MADHTFDRLTREGGACASCHVSTGLFTMANRDVARVFREAARARRVEQIQAKALARIVGIASGTRNQTATRLTRILRVVVAAQREAEGD